MLDDGRGQVAIFSLADKVLIERNRIEVIPPIKPDDPKDPNNPGGGIATLSSPWPQGYEKSATLG